MGWYAEEEWHGNPAAPTAWDRRQGKVSAYVPHPLHGWHPPLAADLAAHLADTETQLRDTARRLGPSESPSALFFWAESLGSSRIEDVTPKARKVNHVMIREAVLPSSHRRGPEGEAVGNIDAVSAALDLLRDASSVSAETIKDTHRTLMASTTQARIGGVMKTTQNWVGGNNWHPLDGDFVPPPPRLCGPLLDDLAAYMRRADHSPLVAACAAHAQFETIHPFGDGNGRTGRALMFAALKHRLAPDGFMPPLSLALSANKEQYLAGCVAYQQYVGGPREPARATALVPMLETVSVSARQACAAADSYLDAVAELQLAWQEAAVHRKGRSAVQAIIEALPQRPSLTAVTAAETTGYSERRCGDALRHLERSGVVRSRRAGPGLRVHDADRVYDLYEIMAATIAGGDAPGEYRRALRSPLLPAHSTASPPLPDKVTTATSAAQSDTANQTAAVAASARTAGTHCGRIITSNGHRCGLYRGHRGHCRTVRR